MNMPACTLYWENKMYKPKRSIGVSYGTITLLLHDIV